MSRSTPTRRRLAYAGVAILTTLCLTLPWTLFRVPAAQANAADPTAGTIHATVVQNSDGTFTVTVSGQWNWANSPPPAPKAGLTPSSPAYCDNSGRRVGYAVSWNDGDGNVVSGNVSGSTVTIKVGSTSKNAYASNRLEGNIVHPTSAGPGLTTHDITNLNDWASWRGGCGTWNGTYYVGTFGPISHIYPSTVQSFDICVLMYDVHAADSTDKSKPNQPNGENSVVAGGTKNDPDNDGTDHNQDNSLQTNSILLGGTGGTPVSLIG